MISQDDLSLKKRFSFLLGAALLTSCGAEQARDTGLFSAPNPPELAPFELESRFVEVLGARMHYVEEGSGPPILLVHGNPTSAFLWRNVIPRLSGRGRVIAVDLIGHGRSDKPDIAYTFRQHVEYLTAFIEVLGLREVTLVVHDAGNVGFSYAARNPENVRALVFFETLLGPISALDDADPMLRDFFTRLRDPEEGPRLVLEENIFIEQLLPELTVRPLTEPELNRYREPFPTPETRRPLLAWPNQLPIDGEPADAFALWTEFQPFLFTTPIPKLMLYVEPGFLLGPEAARPIEGAMRNLTSLRLGEGLHFIPEDLPQPLGDAIGGFLDDLEARSPCPPAPSADPFESRFVEVLGSRMHYLEEGTGRPILLLHGNPTSSYLWRNIIPHLRPFGRVIALDLIGMGRSDQPDIEYTFDDHARYLEGFIEAMGINDDLTLVVHDWGSGLGFDYAARHPEAIRSVAFMEAQVAPVVPASFDALTPEQAALFRALRDPVRGEAMIRAGHFFIEDFLPRFTACLLSREAHDRYRAPFVEPASRTPLVVWPRQIPIDGSPAAMVARADRWNAWLETSNVPKLALYAEPGLFMPREAVEVMLEQLPNLEARSIGRGLHYVQESQPEAIGTALAEWLSRH